jgi:hypothetical protein
MPKKKLPAALAKFKRARDKAMKANAPTFTYKTTDGKLKKYKRHKLKSGMITYKSA